MDQQKVNNWTKSWEHNLTKGEDKIMGMQPHKSGGRNYGNPTFQNKR